ncbi:MAG: hypothetical protein KDE26_03525 [Bacteroidetes bacterium]|nr:hypothetical protein [Bacteroidota bacterium]MCB0842320.1 hypothetical protein [Bacteroidota bacterium]
MKKYVFFLAFWLGGLFLPTFAQEQGNFVLKSDQGEVKGSYSATKVNDNYTIKFSSLTWNPPEANDKFIVKLHWSNFEPNLKLISLNPRPLGTDGLPVLFPIQNRAAGKLNLAINLEDRGSGQVVDSKKFTINYDFLTVEERNAIEEKNRTKSELSSMLNAKYSSIGKIDNAKKELAKIKGRGIADTEITGLISDVENKLNRERSKLIQIANQQKNNEEKKNTEEKDLVEEKDEEDVVITEETTIETDSQVLGQNTIETDTINSQDSPGFDIKSYVDNLSNQQKMIYGGVGGLLIILLLFLIFRKKKEGDSEAVKEKQSIEKVADTRTNKTKEAVKDPVKNEPIIINHGQPKVEMEKETERDQNGQGSMINIVAERKAEVKMESYDLNKLWADTAVKTLSLTGDCIDELNRFVHEENVDIFEENNETMIPEIGGFLLGNYTPVGSKQFDVVINKFVPITPEDNDTYRIEFGTRAWLELDQIKEEFPNLEVIGWFHTHPGHGLFLSRPDLNIHEGFFQKNYQVAMEMDTMTDRLDIAFFTRTKGGIINNTANRIGKNWFSWRELAGEKS